MEPSGDQRLPLLAIVGATGSGKNELAQALGRRMNATLISVDSRKVYRGLDIGTAKPSPPIIREFDYAMIDCADPREYFSAGRFAHEARGIIEQRLRTERPVILVGGTGFYLDALINGLARMPEVSADTRRQLTEEATSRGWDSLYREALSIDPEFMEGIAPTDKTRIRRVVEVWREAGVRLSELRAKERETPSPWPIQVLWPDLPRQELYGRIDARVGRMREAGLTQEVQRLIRSGLSPASPGLATVGYQEILGFLSGSIPTAEAAYELISQNTRQYARRQITWFRHRAYVQRLTVYPITLEYVMGIWRSQI